MMSRKKKNGITLIVLAFALIACLLLYFFLPAKEDPADTEGEDAAAASITVDTVAAGDIVRMAFDKQGKNVWTLVRDSGHWNFAGDASIPVNEEKVTAITDALDPLTASEKIEDVSGQTESYGLRSPEMTFSVTTKDGREHQYRIGIKVPKENMGYYGTSGTEGTVYCLSGALVESVDVTKNSLIRMDTLPQMETDYMTYIKVDNRRGKDFEAKFVSDREKVDFYSNWNITKPYDKPLATSTMEWTKTLGYFNELSYSALVEYGARQLKAYGLDRPSAVVTVKYYEAKEGYTPPASQNKEKQEIPEDQREYKTLTLCIGDRAGDSYYVCEKGSRHVYKMESGAVENMTRLDAYTSMDHCVYSVLATNINGYDVSYGDTSMKITRTPADGKQGATPSPDAGTSGEAVENKTNDNQNNIWKLNGRQIPEGDIEDFLTPYSTAYLLEYSGKAVDGEMTEKSKKPVLTIVYHEENRDVTVKYLPYDGTNFYRVDKNGMDYFLVDKLLVDDIIGKFKEIEKFAP